MNNKKIVVCNKCEAMCFYENFSWTCPLCNKRFKIKNLIKNNINRSLCQNKVKNEDNNGRKSLVISPCRKRKNDNEIQKNDEKIEKEEQDLQEKKEEKRKLKSNQKKK